MKRRSPVQIRPATPAEAMIGRGLALSLHPHIAWNLLPPSRRALLVFGYFAFGYVTVLAGLQLIR